MFQRALSGEPRQFSSVIAANMPESHLRAAEELGITLANKMLATEGARILKVL